MVRIHHLAWVDNLDAGAIVLVQRHEDWVVATADSSKYPPADSRTDPLRTNLGRYYDGSGAPECFSGGRIKGERNSMDGRIVSFKPEVMQVV